MDLHLKFGDSSSNVSRDMQQRSRRMRHFDRFWNIDNCQREVVSDVTSGMVDHDVGVDLSANIGDSRAKIIFSHFSNVGNFRAEVRSNVISGVVVDLTGAKARVKFGDSRSNHSRDI